MKNKAEKIQQIKNISQETEIHVLLEELLVEMGLSDVHITHEKGGKSEDGKDLICSYTNPIVGNKEWWAFVVKKGVIQSNSATLQDIIGQVQECFLYPYENAIKNLKININKVVVVTNDHFSNEAERKIRTAQNLPKANVEFWDAEKIVDFIENKYPQYWLKGSKVYKKYVDAFGKLIETDSFSKSLGVSDKKMKRLLDCAIEPKIVERVEQEDGCFQWKPKKINSIIKLDDNTIIIGAPGSGKSTLFKTLCKEIIEQNTLRNEVEFYPIIINFNSLKSAQYNLLDAIKEYFHSDWNRDLLIDVQKIVNQGNCVIFIDALDELPKISDKEKALKAINEFHNQFKDIKIICSSRPSEYLFYNCTDLGFKYHEISSLDGGQVQNFVNSYFADNLLKSKRLLKSLKDTGILNKLPQTPLTIALITVIFDEKEVEIPATITDLYRQFVDLLIGKYTPENTLDIIEVGAKHRLLCYLAKQLHTQRKQSISTSDFQKLIIDYSAERGQSIDADKISEDIIMNTGLLFKNEIGEIQFKHLSFQEYFTAYEIFHHNQVERELFVKQFNNLWWQNVAIFYAGMTKDAPDLLNEIIHESTPKNFNDYIANTSGLGKILQALYNTPIAKRQEGITRGHDNIVKAFQTIVKNEEKNLDVWRNFSQYGLMQIIGAWFTMSYWSVTLVEPLKRQFEELLMMIDQDRPSEEQTQLEYKLFLICSILATEDFIQFEQFKQLVEKTKSQDLSLYAVLTTHYRRLHKILPEEQRSNEALQWAGKKLLKRGRTLGNIAPYVNTPVKNILQAKQDNNVADNANDA